MFIGDKISNTKPIALSEMVEVPSFLRFSQVSLSYRFVFNCSKSISQKCESFRWYLPSIKARLNDSNIIHFECQISEEDPTQFNDYTTLLEHIRHIVSICDSARGYSFQIFVAFNYAVGNLIGSILEMPAIANSSFVSIGIVPFGHIVIELPVEIISNWLNQERHSMEQKEREREFRLNCFVQNAYQVQKMCDFLKQVSFSFPNI